MFQEEYKRIKAEFDGTTIRDGIIYWANTNSIPHDPELMEFLAFSLITEDVIERSRAARESFQETLERIQVSFDES